MDKETLLFNIARFAEARNESPSHACISAGCGKSFTSDIRRGQIPSVAKIAELAAYLGVTASDLIGDTRFPADLAPLSCAWSELNEEGRERLIRYSEDLVASGRYKKSTPDHLDQEQSS